VAFDHSFRGRFPLVFDGGGRDFLIAVYACWPAIVPLLPPFFEHPFPQQTELLLFWTPDINPSQTCREEHSHAPPANKSELFGRPCVFSSFSGLRLIANRLNNPSAVVGPFSVGYRWFAVCLMGGVSPPWKRVRIKITCLGRRDCYLFPTVSHFSYYQESFLFPKDGQNSPIAILLIGLPVPLFLRPDMFNELVLGDF